MGQTKRMLEEQMEKEAKTKTCPECDERTFEITTNGHGGVSGKCTECGYEDEGDICVECDDFFKPEDGEIICQDCFDRKVNEED